MSILKVDLLLDSPYLETNFSNWKNAIQIFIESTDMELLESMNNGPYYIPKIKNDKGEVIDKPKDQYTSAN